MVSNADYRPLSAESEEFELTRAGQTTKKTDVPPPRPTIDQRLSSLLPFHRNLDPKNPRSKRSIIAIFAALTILAWLSIALLFRHTKMSDTSSSSPPPSQDASRLGKHPTPSDLIQLLDMSSSHLPKTGKHHGAGRLVVVGDVHGMVKELQALLDKIDFDKKHDHLILAGDMIAKGPDSAGVIDLAMHVGASAVRGNHEDRVLLAAGNIRSKYVGTGEEKTGDDEDGENEVSEEANFTKAKKLVKELGHKRLQWLKERPVILRVGKLGSMGEVTVVHAGLNPGVTLEKQDPLMVMNMRTITKDGEPSDERDGKAWQKAWNKFQKKLSKHERTTVIYGHDSKRGLQIEHYSMGIDTGCVKGEKLTAVVIEAGASDYSHKLVHVKCKDRR